jgi:hypothetical protein
MPPTDCGPMWCGDCSGNSGFVSNAWFAHFPVTGENAEPIPVVILIKAQKE